MTIEVGRFSDKRLKVIRKHSKTDSNVRVDEKEITIVSKIDEVELERDVIEAANIWNLMKTFPELRKEIRHILERYFQNPDKLIT
jgi:septum formation topological specificity factor MinE